MVTRRDFLSGMAAGTAVLAASSLISTPAVAKPAAPVTKQSAKTKGGKYRPPFRLGLGGAPIGTNSYPVTDEEAQAVLEGAWDSGVRLYDTSPWYGLGLSERRFGRLLHDQKRSDYVLSTKVGRILTAAPKPSKTNWLIPDSFEYKYDYSAAGARRSVEDSLQRLGVSSIDIVFIHDLSPDNKDMGDKWGEYFDGAAKGAMPELTKMREEGLIKAWGFGVNTLPPILRALEEGDPDIFLAACQYSLIEHEESVSKLFPACDAKGVSIMVGSPLNNGFLSGRDRYNYGKTIPAGFKEKRTKIETIAKAHGTDLRTAALQFAAAPETVSCIVPGSSKAQQPGENVASLAKKIPADFWAELRSEKLIAENAAVPA